MASYLQKTPSGNESHAGKEKMMKWVFRTLVKDRDGTSCSSSSSESRKKRNQSHVKPWHKRRKNLELWLEEEYNYNIRLQMTSENFDEIFQLTKDDIPKENTNLRELIPPKL